MKSASFAASIGCSHDFGCHVHMTVGDMAIFVRHSIDLLLPFVGDVSDPLWQCFGLLTSSTCGCCSSIA